MKTQKGITLIALIITIIVMLILVGVSVSAALNGGLFKAAQGAAKNTQLAGNEELALSNGTVTIGGITYSSLEEYLATLSGNYDMYLKVGDTVISFYKNDTWEQLAKRDENVEIVNGYAKVCGYWIVDLEFFEYVFEGYETYYIIGNSTSDLVMSTLTQMQLSTKAPTDISGEFSQGGPSYGYTGIVDIEWETGSY